MRKVFFEQKAQRVEPTEKPDLEDVVQERGYVKRDPMPYIEERPLPPPVPVYPPSTTPGVPRTEGASKDKYDNWNYPYELSQRNWKAPHIIHQDEYASNENDQPQTTYTYYEGDNTLADTDDSILENPEYHVGPKALQHFVMAQTISILCMSEIHNWD
jgi:hypothetical protein